MNPILELFMLAIPVACVSWTVTHEELFREFHEYSVDRSEDSKTLFGRKFFYLFTCEYCFSHYVTIALLIIAPYTLVFAGWRGYLIAFFSIVFIANAYMSLFAKIRIDIKRERKTIEKIEKSL